MSEEFSDGCSGIAEVTVIHLETFQVSFPEIIDSSTIHRLADFIGVFEQESAEFTSNCTADRRM